MVESTGNGSAIITVTAKDGSNKSASCTIDVKQCVFVIVLNKESLSLTEGQTETLTATIFPGNAFEKSLVWTSSDDKIATVDENGKVTAKSKGSVTIKATAIDGSGKFAECPVNVLRISGDLGLSVKWATSNLCESGLCENPYDYGDYYAWGETEAKSFYHWTTYKWCNQSGFKLTKYCNSASDGYQGFIDSKTVLDKEDDAANTILGGNWRIPTAVEWQELIDKCSWEWVGNYNESGTSGMLVTAPNGNSIFLPAAGSLSSAGLYGAASYGSYWSSSIYTDNQNCACRVSFHSPNLSDDSTNYQPKPDDAFRACGLPIRPVSD